MLRLKSARAMLIAAMCAFGTLGPFVRNISVSSGELALYRAVMAALLLAGYLLLTGQRIEFKSVRKESVLLLVSGMAMGVNWILLFEAYRYTTVSVATLSYYFAPVIVTAACPFLFHEKLTVKQVICFAMSTLGLVLVINVTGMGGGTDNIGVLFGVGAAVFYAAVILLNKFIKSVAGIQRTFLQFASAIVILVPYVAWHQRRDAGSVDQPRVGLPFGGGPFPYRRYILSLFFCAEGAARTRSRTFELHRSAGGRAGIRPDPGGADNRCSAFRWFADPGIYLVERISGQAVSGFFGAGGSAAVIDESAW